MTTTDDHPHVSKWEQEARDEARDRYATDEVNIDHGAAVSESDDGAWVQAWVWVPRPTTDDDRNIA